jgi:hypothetical protein
MWRLSPYQDLLEKGKSCRDAIFLDIGSCSENHGIIANPRFIYINNQPPYSNN